MNDSNLKTTRNPITQITYRRQSFWQILFPLLLGSLAILAIGVWAILTVAQGGEVSRGADTSLIFLLIPTMFMALIPLFLFAGVIYGLIWLKQNLPSAMYRVHQVIEKVHEGVLNGADKAAEPILRISSIAASIKALKPNKE